MAASAAAPIANRPRVAGSGIGDGCPDELPPELPPVLELDAELAGG